MEYTLVYETPADVCNTNWTPKVVKQKHDAYNWLLDLAHKTVLRAASEEGFLQLFNDYLRRAHDLINDKNEVFNNDSEINCAILCFA